MIKSTIDLHIHSNHSLDGTKSIDEILSVYEKENISVISITEHDTCNSYYEINKKFNGTILYGMEADALIGQKTYDILCYGFNLDEVAKWADNQYTTIQNRQQKIFDELLKLCKEKGIELDLNNPFNPDTEFAHMALFRMLENTSSGKQLLSSYNINSVGDLYREGTTNEKFPLYIDMKIVWPTIEEVNDIIHKNGGKTFLAHPFKYGNNSDVENILNTCLPYIDGIEIYNEPEDISQVNYLYEFAQNNNLLISVGSDFHGTEKHGSMGNINISKEQEEEIINWINKCPGKRQDND